MKAVAEPLPAIMVMLFAIVSIIQSGPVTDQLGQTLQNSATDIGRLSQARAHYDSTYGAAISSAARFAVHESSYELGQDSAGIEWRWKNLQSIPGRATSTLDSAANQRLSNYEFDPPGKCAVPPDLEPAVSTQYPEQNSFRGINLELSASKSSISCQFKRGKVTYSDQYGERVYARNNRYLFMVEEAKQYHQELRSRLSNMVGTRDATRSSCISFDDAEDSASSAANNQIQSDIRQAFSSSDYPPYHTFPDWMSVKTRSIKNQGESLDTGGGSTDIYRTSSESTDKIDDDADCDYPNPSPAVAEVTITPKLVQTRLRVVDEARDSQDGWRIPVQGNWRKPVLDVKHYSQNLVQD